MRMEKLELLPALDIRAGEAVRLIQGDLSQHSMHGSALDVALEFQSAGAEWIHLVDLDAAFRTGSNYDLLVEVVGKLDVKVQLSGGIRDQSLWNAHLRRDATELISLLQRFWICHGVNL
ncbi:phosphoribosyl isomerase A [Clavibacter sp.]|nr:phosphoribosyl isomerase A [Clavibacter sp.]